MFDEMPGTLGERSLIPLAKALQIRSIRSAVAFAGTCQAEQDEHNTAHHQKPAEAFQSEQASEAHHCSIVHHCLIVRLSAKAESGLVSSLSRDEPKRTASQSSS
jgi:hypothetical protein